MLAKELIIGERYNSTAFNRSVKLLSIDEVDRKGNGKLTVEYYGKQYVDFSFRLSETKSSAKAKSDQSKAKNIYKAQHPKLIITDIEWDVDDEEDLDSLPNRVVLQGKKAMMTEDEVSDYLSDTYGFCHYGFKMHRKNK